MKKDDGPPMAATGTFLKEARSRAGVTQAEVAKKAGVCVATVQNWERNGIRAAGSGEAKAVSAMAAIVAAWREKGKEVRP